MRSLSRNSWWICLAVLLLVAPHRLAAQQTVTLADLGSAQTFAASPQLPSEYTSPADTDCTLPIQTSLVNASAVQHRLSSFDVDDPDVPQSQHRRNIAEAAAVHLGQPSVAFARLYPSRESSESYRVFHPAGRAPPAI